jgi:uncharacterized delta-60 repeat protein
MLDPSFGIGGKVTTKFPIPSDDYGKATAIDSLGRIVVAGNSYNHFETDFDFQVVRLLPSGALDTTFGGTGVVCISFGDQSDDVVYSVAVDSQNRVVVAGSTRVGSQTDFAVARLTITGALDSSFDSDGKQTIVFGAVTATARGVAIDSQDRVVLAGFTSTSSSDSCVVARLTVTGALDSSFDADGRQTINLGANGGRGYCVAVDSFDRIVVGGFAFATPTSADFAVARLTTAGAPDISFGGNGLQTIDFGMTSEVAYGVDIDSLGRIVVVGETSLPGNSYAVARLTPAGVLDTSFDGDGKQTIGVAGASAPSRSYSVVVDSMNRVIVGGPTTIGSSVDFAVARLTVAGSLDTSFDGDGKETIDFGSSEDYGQAVAIDSQDRVVIAGYKLGPGNNGRNHDFAVARLSTAGALDASFDSDGKLILPLNNQSLAKAHAVAVDSQGRTIVAGGSQQQFAVARYTPAGRLDSTFNGIGIITFTFPISSGPADDTTAYAVTIDSLDRIIVAGTATDSLDHYDFAIARLTAAGALDVSFDGDGRQTIDFGGDDVAFGIDIDSLGRLVVGGSVQVNTMPVQFAVARLTTTGALDTSFDSDGKESVAVGAINSGGRDVVCDPLDRIIMAGNSYNGNDQDFAVIRLTPAGALDASFDGDGKTTFAFGTPVDDYARSVALDSLGRIVVAGYTNLANAGAVVARLTASGALDTNFDSDGRQSIDFAGAGDSAYGVAVDSLDRVVVSGYSFNGRDFDFAVGRLTPAGVMDSAFNGSGQQIISFAADPYGTAIVVDSANRVIIAGESNYLGQTFGVTRLTGDTTNAVAVVNDGSAQRSRVTSLTVRFSGQVTFSGSPDQAFTLLRNGGGAVSFTATVSVQNGGTVVLLDHFTGSETEFGSLADGRYTLTALASQISAGGQALDGDADGTPGGNLVFSDAQGFFRLFGDLNGDQTVNGFDLGFFRNAFGTQTGDPNYLSYLDLNGDGVINGFDLGQFRTRFGAMLP